MNQYLIKNPTIEENWQNYGFNAVSLYDFMPTCDVRYCLIPSSPAESLWCIGFIANIGSNGSQPIILSNLKDDVKVYCNCSTFYSTGYSNIEELTYSGKTYYYSALNDYPMGWDPNAIHNNIIPLANESFSDYNSAAQKLIELYKAEGGLMPGEGYHTSWVRKLVNGVWQKTFAFAHAKTVYTDFANKKTLADKLSEMDDTVANKYKNLDNNKLPHKTITAATDFNTLTDTCIYHIRAVSNTNAPITGSGTLYVDSNVGTPYQIFVCDGSTIKAYKRWIAKGSWLSWVELQLTDTTYGDASASSHGLMTPEMVTKLAGIDNAIIELSMLGWSVPKNCPVQNEINGNQFVQKVGRVDLGSLRWDYESSIPRYYTSALKSSIKAPENDAEYFTGYLKDYKSASLSYLYSDSTDKVIAVSIGANVSIKDKSYTDVITFKSVMQGQYLYYELATPITTTIDGNEIGEGVSAVRKETTVNLLNPTLQTTTQNGVTCTNNGDGSYTFTGTATSDYEFMIANLTLKPGKYKYFGGLAYIRKADDTYVSTIHDGAIAEITEDNPVLRCVYYASAGATSNDTIKFMVTTNLNATIDNFVPYTGITGSLNGDVADLRSDVADFNKKVMTKRILLTTDLKNDYYRYIMPKPGSNEIYTPPIVVDESEESDDSSAAGDIHSYAWRSQTIMDILDLENSSGITKDGITITYHASRPSSGKKLYTVKGTATSDIEIPLYSVSNPKDAPLYFTSNRLSSKMSESTFYVKVSDTAGEQIIMGTGSDISKRMATHTGKVTVSLVVKSGTVIRLSVINIKCGYSKMGYVADYSSTKYSDEVDNVIDAILDLDSRLKVLENK